MSLRNHPHFNRGLSDEPDHSPLPQTTREKIVAAARVDIAMGHDGLRGTYANELVSLFEQLEAALGALDRGKRFERFYQESLGATPTTTQFEILDNLQSAFIDAYAPLLSNPASRRES